MKKKSLPPLEPAHDHDHVHASSTNPFMPWVNALILVGTGILFALLLVTGNIQNYINTEFIAYTYIGAAILLALGTYATLGASGRTPTLHNSHFGLVAAAVFAVPLIFGILVPSRPLGLDAVTDDIDAADIVARTESSNISIVATDTWNVLDWLAAYYTTDDFTQLEGQPADIVGFVRKVEGDGREFFRITRFMVNCCVADTISVDMPVRTADSVPVSGLDDGQWVRVTGNAAIGEFSGDTQPFVEASAVELLDKAPEPSYLYP